MTSLSESHKHNFRSLGKIELESANLGMLENYEVGDQCQTQKNPLFETAGGRPVQVSASGLARAYALLGEESGGDM